MIKIEASVKQKPPKGMSQIERLVDLFDKGFERVGLRPFAPSGPDRNKHVPYTLQMDIIRENGNYMMQTIVYDRDERRRRKTCRYLGTFKFFICAEKDAKAWENDIHS
jgi:hypothetical protein